MENSDQQLIDSIRNGEVAAFEMLYEKYYQYLCLVSEHIVKNPSDAEEIVSDVFIKLWTIRKKIEITTSLKAYLIRAVYNTSLNHLERRNLRMNINYSFPGSDYELLVWDNNYPLGKLYENEILNILEKGISDLPEACREIFLLSRNDNLRYSDIACKLDISVNTVKTQMKIALARLRDIMKDYLVIIIILIGI